MRIILLATAIALTASSASARDKPTVAAAPIAQAAPPGTIALYVSPAEIQVIASALSQMPYGQAAPVVDDLRGQVQRQAYHQMPISASGQGPRAAGTR